MFEEFQNVESVEELKKMIEERAQCYGFNQRHPETGERVQNSDVGDIAGYWEEKLYGFLVEVGAHQDLTLLKNISRVAIFDVLLYHVNLSNIAKAVFGLLGRKSFEEIVETLTQNSINSLANKFTVLTGTIDDSTIDDSTDRLLLIKMMVSSALENWFKIASSHLRVSQLVEADPENAEEYENDITTMEKAFDDQCAKLIQHLSTFPE